ncbi:MAG: F0F1 ATP synthase subunit B [Alphaproteobacteria bacterium]
MRKMVRTWQFWVFVAFLVLAAVLGGVATDSVGDANIWILAAFICFFLVFGGTAYQKMVGGLDARTARIKAELDDAQKLREDAQHLLDDYRTKRAQAEADALKMLEHAELEAERRAAQGKRDLEIAMERRAEMALQRIAQAEADALKEVRGAAASLAVQATARLLHDNLDPPRAEALVQDSIRQVQQKLH